jgi:hypothetical protein
MASAKKKQPAKEGSPYSDEETARVKKFFTPFYPRDIYQISKQVT